MVPRSLKQAPHPTGSFTSSPNTDPIALAFQSCFDACSASAAFLVTGLGDVLAAVAHPSASRVAVSAILREERGIDNQYHCT